MKAKKAHQMFKSMRPGEIYRQADLQQKWPNASHDLKCLLQEGKIKQVSAGLYYRPQKTKYGPVSPRDEELVRNFLKDNDFLLLDTNQYNSLISGLTQLAMGQKVLNRRRHGYFELAGFPFDFKVRRNFPKKATKSFLLVDLLDSLEQIEDGTSVKEKVLEHLHEYEPQVLLRDAARYGNKSTLLFLKKALER